MPSSERSSEIALADRLVSYADALVAVAFVGVSGLGLAAADPDIRVDLARATEVIVVANLFTAAAFTVAMFRLKRWELDLRSDSDLSEKVQHIARRLHFARLAIVWISAAQAMALAWALR